MKNLKDLSDDDRVLITIGCEPFYIGFKRYPELKSIHKRLMLHFSPNHEKEVWVFINAAVSPVKHCTFGSLFTLSKENYTSANNKNKSNISYVKCKRVVDRLDELGYIDMYVGFYDHYKQVSVKSCFVINDKLRCLFDGVNLKRVVRDVPEHTLVELRDGTTKEQITDLSRLKNIAQKRDLVKKYNDLLKSFDIRCKSVPVCAVYKRVFTDDFNQHGRWYSQSALQTTKSTLRKHISINGVRTTEVDFKQLHPRILYQLDGIHKPFEWEPYTDISDIVGDDKGKARSLSKMAMMCLLNSESLKQAKSALWKIFKDNNDFKGMHLGKGNVNKIFERLIEKNTEISHWFGKEKLWAMLQHYDSEIATYTIEVFISHSKCILPWHDSFVVMHHDRDLLINTMKEAWKFVLGNNSNCYYDIEF